MRIKNDRILSLIKYIFYSGMTAVFESVLGVLLLHFCRLSEVPANTIGILFGSVVHYFCVTRSVFRSSVNWKTAAVYISTFLLGIVIQNTVVWTTVRLLGNAVGNDLRYLIAKAVSLVVSFFVMYYIRKYCYRRVSGNPSEKTGDSYKEGSDQ